jgi:hypothetical protein
MNALWQERFPARRAGSLDATLVFLCILAPARRHRYGRKGYSCGRFTRAAAQKFGSAAAIEGCAQLTMIAF